MDGLKHASTMLGELRTSILSPKNYYELCIFFLDNFDWVHYFLCQNSHYRHVNFEDFKIKTFNLINTVNFSTLVVKWM